MKTEYLLNREVEHVLAALMPVNRVIMRVCIHTGVRIGDVLALRTDQIRRRFWVTEQKTGKRRIVGLPEHLLLDMRKIAGKKYVFEHKNDPERHRTRQAVWKDVKRAAVAFRLLQNVAPHSVRKVYAVDLMLSFSCGHCTRNLFVEVWGTPKYQSRAATTNRARNAAKP